MLWAVRKFVLVAAILSLILCMTVCFIWIRSALLHSWEINSLHILVNRSGGKALAEEMTFSFNSDDGVFCCWFNEVFGTNKQAAEELAFEYRFFEHQTTLEANDSPHVSRWYFKKYHDEPWRQGRTTTGFQFQVPDWIAALATAVLPVSFVVGHFVLKHRERRTIALNLCRKCRYDLRASGDRCPECGTIRKSGAATASTD